MWTGSFWKAAAERAVRTFAQALAAVMTADGLNLLDADWTARLSAAAAAALLSLLTSLAASQVGNSGPSLANEVVTEQPEAYAPPPER